jgi:hypothetical protein
VIYLKNAAIDWSPLNVPAKRVPGHVVEDQRAEGSPVYIRIDGNLQLLVVAPERVHPRGRWDGHEWDPDGKLGAKPAPPGPLVEMPLPDRLVYVAQQAIEEAALTKWHGHTDVYSVDGHPLDFAKAASVAVVEALAVDMDAHGGAGYAALLRMLANSVREVA